MMITDTDMVQTLGSIAFFKGIPDAHLARLAEHAQVVDFHPDSEIFHEQDIAENVYFIVSGRVALIICLPKLGCRRLMEVGDGEIIGLSPLVGRSRLWDTARAVTATRAIALNGKETLELCEEIPPLGFEMMHRVSTVMAERLTASRKQFLEFCNYQVPDVPLESD